MSPAPVFRYERMVDLSRPLRPREHDHPWFHYDARPESIVTKPAEVPASGRWYVVTQLELSGHAGTHVEAPLHAVEGGLSIGELPVERFFGEAVVLDLSDVPWAEPFDLGCVQQAAARAGGIAPGDILFMRFDWDRRAGADGARPPYPTPAALQWIVNQGVKLVGIDSPGLEVPGNPALVNHHTLLDRGIPLIESLAHLDVLREPRIFVFAQPIPAYGSDAIPIRVLAFEGS
ncbi:MAG: cyclase family protein [Chloroflexi bacterium]|nr:cyclase family protein [Chloroflexota bacterium]